MLKRTRPNSHELEEKARRASELLGDALLNEAFDALETEYMTAWRLTKASQSEEREKVWMAITMLKRVREQLAQWPQRLKIDQAAVRKTLAK